jgi:hypothetical protein
MRWFASRISGRQIERWLLHHTAPTLYFNLYDSVNAIAQRFLRQHGPQLFILLVQSALFKQIFPVAGTYCYSQ